MSFVWPVIRPKMKAPSPPEGFPIQSLRIGPWDKKLKEAIQQMDSTTIKLETLYFEVQGIRLHAQAAGPSNGPVVILLHGFPEFWMGWKKQIEPLAQLGYRVIVPDAQIRISTCLHAVPRGSWMG